MIGFYSNVGYINVNDANFNLSDVTFLDINRPLTIPVIKEMPPESVLLGGSSLGSDDLSEALALIDKYIGPDWYVVYQMGCLRKWNFDDTELVENTPSDYIRAKEEYTKFIPGWDKSWPNSLAYAEQLSYEEWRNHTWVLHIPNLKRVLLWNSSVSLYGMYRPNEDGSLTLVSEFPSSYYPFQGGALYLRRSGTWGGTGTMLALKIPYKSFDDLKKWNNLLLMGTSGRVKTTPPTSYNYAIFDWYGNRAYQYQMQNLFTDGTEPDYIDYEPITPTPPDPSGPGGGGGTFDDTSDPIDFPELPTLSASSTGMMNLYSPSVSQLRNLAEYMWSDAFDIDSFKKLFGSPMDVIIGLSMIPVQPIIGPIQNITIGFVDTGVACTTVENQYVIVECGTLDIKEFFGTALDYSPYTKFSIYLPFIGTKELKTDDIMGKTIEVRYTVDVLSGSCTAHIKCGESVLYQYSGSCSTTIPITSQEWSNMITSIIQLAGAGIATAVTGGAAAASLIPAAANTIASMKPEIQRAGAVSSSAGFLGIQYPYLIWEHPRKSEAAGYNKFVGYPSNITDDLGGLTGFTQVESIHLENVPATQNELIEIENLLKEGVIF